mmetsp:Transcript_36639/g.88800  ORF Transcript_36639/g.88800 Transcript_36639/m.88800 type:complete len:88 (-) Transcript_36639:337-600(-)
MCAYNWYIFYASESELDDLPKLPRFIDTRQCLRMMGLSLARQTNCNKQITGIAAATHCDFASKPACGDPFRYRKCIPSRVHWPKIGT